MKYEVIWTKLSVTKRQFFNTATLAELMSLKLQKDEEVETILIRPTHGQQTNVRLRF